MSIGGLLVDQNKISELVWHFQLFESYNKSAS